MKHIARKRFGQNFLKDPTIIHAIMNNLNINKNDHWIEIGPGLGALTEPLLMTGIALSVIEIDRDLVSYLKQKFAQQANLTIINQDVLKFNFSDVTQAPNKFRIIGNLPYNISTPLLLHLMTFVDGIEDMFFMLQKELVDRICATPNNKQYGRLSVMLQYYCQTESLFDVPPESFNPVPQVNSAILCLIPHKTPIVQVDNMDCFQKIVTQAFAQRRKTLRNTLKDYFNEDGLKNLGIDSQLRAENLSLQDFALLSNALNDLNLER